MEAEGFYWDNWDNASFRHSVQVFDKEGGSLAKGEITPEEVLASVHDLPEGRKIKGDLEMPESFTDFMMPGQYLEVKGGSYIAYKNIDLTSIGKITISGEAKENGGTIEVRTGSPSGELIGQTQVKPTPEAVKQIR